MPQDRQAVVDVTMVKSFKWLYSPGYGVHSPHIGKHLQNHPKPHTFRLFLHGPVGNYNYLVGLTKCESLTVIATIQKTSRQWLAYLICIIHWLPSSTAAVPTPALWQSRRQKQEQPHTVYAYYAITDRHSDPARPLPPCASLPPLFLRVRDAQYQDTHTTEFLADTVSWLYGSWMRWYANRMQHPARHFPLINLNRLLSRRHHRPTGVCPPAVAQKHRSTRVLSTSFSRNPASAPASWLISCSLPGIKKMSSNNFMATRLRRAILIYVQ